MRPLVVGTLALILTVSAVLYLTRLSLVPAYLMQDEVNFALQAHAIATTGRDANRRLLPVYFSEVGFEAGRDPLMIYWTALFLTVGGLSETAVRFPTALLAVLTIALTFVLCQRWFRSDATALAAAMLLAVTPGYFTNARLALSITYAIPLIVLWLLSVERALDGERRRWALAAGACLGLGLYSYLASMIVMPVLLLVTIALLVRLGHSRLAIHAAAGFAVLVVPLALWLAFHPDRFTSLLAAYRPVALTSGAGIQDRLTAYWMFFNPDYLFISGDGRLTNSTRAAGLFPIAFAFLIPVGVYRLIRGTHGPVGVLVVAGLMLSPLATVASGRLDINRVLCVIPFGVMAAAAGANYLWSRGGAVRMVSGVLVVSVAVQFAGFYRNYAGPYRIASGAWFGGDNRTAVNAVLDRVTPDTPRIYLDRRTPIERYWRFYTAARDRDDLAEVPTYYDPLNVDFTTAPAGSLLVCESADLSCRDVRGGGWTLIASGTEPDGVVSHEVYLKNP